MLSPPVRCADSLAEQDNIPQTFYRRKACTCALFMVGFNLRCGDSVYQQLRLERVLKATLPGLGAAVGIVGGVCLSGNICSVLGWVLAVAGPTFAASSSEIIRSLLRGHKRNQIKKRVDRLIGDLHAQFFDDPNSAKSRAAVFINSRKHTSFFLFTRTDNNSSGKQWPHGFGLVGSQWIEPRFYETTCLPDISNFNWDSIENNSPEWNTVMEIAVKTRLIASNGASAEEEHQAFETIRNLSLHSRCYYTAPIKVGGKTKGAVLLESMDEESHQPLQCVQVSLTQAADALSCEDWNLLENGTHPKG